MGNAQITLQTFEGLAMLRGLFRLLAILGNDPLVIPDQSGDIFPHWRSSVLAIRGVYQRLQLGTQLQLSSFAA